MSDSHASHRWPLLTGAMVAAVIILLIPSAVLSADQQPLVVIIAEAIVCGVVVGIGRQGIDLLAVRLLIVSVSVVAGWVAVSRYLHHTSICTATPGCTQGIALGIVFGAVVMAIFLALIAVPATLLWNRGAKSLAPEFHWRVLKPRSWWQWVLLVLGVLVILFAIQFALGIPTPP